MDGSNAFIILENCTESASDAFCLVRWAIGQACRIVLDALSILDCKSWLTGKAFIRWIIERTLWNSGATDAFALIGQLETFVASLASCAILVAITALVRTGKRECDEEENDDFYHFILLLISSVCIIMPTTRIGN
jgi:hypothetical protein